MSETDRVIIVGKTSMMQSILERAALLATIPRPILIRGERGTGKELLARFIHLKSERAKKPFLALNCAVYNDELLANELFGHERGAYTGADTDYLGALERAHGGTLFFDEVGNMSTLFQSKMLRVIEDKTFQRLGGARGYTVDVRFIFATNADLETMMGKSEFRRDFYDRISFETLKLPPLRERKKDISLLIEHFVALLIQEIPNFEPRGFTPEAVRQMTEYYWPGNIRELKNVVERLQLREVESALIQMVDLPREIAASAPVGGSFSDKVEAYKRHLIISTWKDTGYNQKKAAEQLGMTYDQFRHYYKKYGLKDLEGERDG